MGTVISSNKDRKTKRDSGLTNIASRIQTKLKTGRNSNHEVIIQQRNGNLADREKAKKAKIRLTSSLIPSNSVSVQQMLAENREKKEEEPLRNNTTDKHLNTITMHKLLTFGWIRKYCKPPQSLSQSQSSNHIPSNILEICFDFIYIERILFCFIASSSSAIQAIDIHNIYKTQYQSSPNINIGYDTNGICIYSSSQITFPTQINDKYNINTIENQYHTIFKCGSQNTRDAKAIIIPKKQFLSKNNTVYTNKTMTAYEWLLPALPSDIASYGNCVSFSGRHGLVSTGGTQPDIFLGAGSYSGVLQLKWTQQHNNCEPLKWKSLRRMNTGRAHASSTFFMDAEEREQLFVCGGDLNGSVEIYNFELNQWTDASNTNVSRECAGIFYDKYENLIFLGGGHGAQKKVECYDIYKNEWNIFPNTNCNHDFYPSLFISSYHYDILYIISPRSNLCEYIDKRQGGKWNILYDNELHDKLFKIPKAVEFEQFRFFN